MLTRRDAVATTVVSFGACLLGYAGRCFGWYWDNVITPEPIRDYEILIHQGNIGHVNPDYYVTMVITPKGIWMRIDGKLIPYEEYLKKNVYVRARAPMTKGQYKIKT